MSSDPDQITFFAQTDARGQQVPFGIKASDRTKHVYVIGKTGMGKSTLLENMAIQDIKNGNGLAFIDPHGQTAETLLDYVPESRKNDVLYFAPFDTANPVSFNVMEDVGEDRRHLVVSGLMSVFKKIWVDAWSARMEYILSNTLLALLEYPDSTLLGVNRMLSDKVYRKKVIDNITDPSVKSFWVDEFLKYNERYMQEAGDAIKNKIGQFTSNPLIRNIVGQPKSSFDIREIMDQKKILIMNLSKGLVGETNANLLGSMLTTRIYLAAMSRADMSQEAMRSAPNFYFYVDEFQSFANATFANILSEARKYKLNLTIAHQYVEQMEEEVRNAVFGNVGTLISFRVGPFDAEILETVFTPKFLAPDIVNLGFAQIYLTLMIDGIGSQPFSATTLPPIKPASISCKDMIIHRSRQQFAHPREEVEKAIFDWHAPDAIPAPVAKREERAPVAKSDTDSKPPLPAREPQQKEVQKFDSNARKERTDSYTEIKKENTVERFETKKESITVRTQKVDFKEVKESVPPSTQQPETKPVVTEVPPLSQGAPVQPEKAKESDRERKERLRQSQQSFQKAKQAPVGGTKNLDELRAVLRTISSPEVKKPEPNEKSDAKPPSTQNSNGNSRVDAPIKETTTPEIHKGRTEDAQQKTLRTNNSPQPLIPEAVAHNKERENDVLYKNVNRPTPSFSKVTSEYDAASETTTRYFQGQQESPVSESQKVTSSPEAVRASSGEHSSDALSPKKLERMMRVTINDKTPLG